MQRSPCLPRSSPKSSLLCPVRLGQSAQLPAAGTSCASRLLKGASFRTSRIFESIQNCRLRTGSRIRAGFDASVIYFFEASLERLFLLVGWQFRQ